MTLIIKSNAVSSSIHDPINYAKALADAPVANIPGMNEWMRPDYGLTNPGNGTVGNGGSIIWKGMLKSIPFTAISTTGPQLIAEEHNDQPCLRFVDDANNGRMIDAANNVLWPGDDSYSIGYVAKFIAGSAAYVVGTNSSAYARIEHTAGNNVRPQLVNTGSPLFTGYAPGDTVPHFGLFSYAAADDSWAFYVNGVLRSSGTTSDLSNAQAVIIGSAGPIGAGPFKGDLYDMMFISRPMHRDADVGVLAALNSYVSARYAIF